MEKRFRLAVASVQIDDCVAGCLDAIAQAGQAKVDLLVLPEEPDVVRGDEAYQHRLEEHPLFVELRQAARDAGVRICGSLSVKVDGGVANMGFLLDRDGKLIGTYAKKHPAPTEEIIAEAPIVGDPFPVFDLDGTKVALAICMDIHFPEMFRIYGLKGADIVCVSTMYMDYTGDMLESIEKARAIDSGMYFALSRYIQTPYLAGKSMGYAKVIAPDGRVISSTAHRPGVAVVDIDPKWRFEFWSQDPQVKERYPDLRIMFDKIRRPELYGQLVESNEAGIRKSRPSEETSKAGIRKSRPSEETNEAGIRKSHPSEESSQAGIRKSRPSQGNPALASPAPGKVIRERVA